MAAGHTLTIDAGGLTLDGGPVGGAIPADIQVTSLAIYDPVNDWYPTLTVSDSTFNFSNPGGNLADLAAAGASLVNLTAGGGQANNTPLTIVGATGQTGDLTQWRTPNGAVMARVTSAGIISSAGTSTQGERFGASSTAGDYALACGYLASAGLAGTALGRGATAGVFGLAIGQNCNASNYGIAIGASVSGGNATVAIGPGLDGNSGAGHVLVGSSFTTSAYFQNGFGSGRGTLPAVAYAGWFGVASGSGQGYEHRLFGRSLTAARDMAVTATEWADAPDATRKARARHGVFDAASDTTYREYLRGESDGTAARLGFFGAAAVNRPTVTGSRSGGAALTSLLTALSGLGLITDSTTA